MFIRLFKCKTNYRFDIFLHPLILKEHTSEDPYDCYNLVSNISEPNKTLLEWLLDLMVDIVKHSDENAMTSTNLGKFYFQNPH